MLLEIWRRRRGGVLAGLGFVGQTPPAVLPEAGGVMDQPACVLASLDAMDAAYAALASKVRSQRSEVRKERGA